MKKFRQKFSLRYWQYYTLLFLVNCLASCTWSAAEYSKTKNHFQENRDFYHDLAAQFNTSTEDTFDLDSLLDNKFSKGAMVNALALYKPVPQMEITPFDFYYCLVYAPQVETVNQTSAMRDEGRVMDDLGNGWFLVQRGFM